MKLALAILAIASALALSCLRHEPKRSDIEAVYIIEHQDDFKRFISCINIAFKAFSAFSGPTAMISKHFKINPAAANAAPAMQIRDHSKDKDDLSFERICFYESKNDFIKAVFLNSDNPPTMVYRQILVPSCSINQPAPTTLPAPN